MWRGAVKPLEEALAKSGPMWGLKVIIILIDSITTLNVDSNPRFPGTNKWINTGKKRRLFLTV